MTADQFRKLALSLPDAIEGSHHAHPDFRVGGKIFASLWPDGKHGMVKVSMEQQAVVVAAEPDVYEPAAGAWGRAGCTRVVLKKAKVASLRAALNEAWRNVASRALDADKKAKTKKRPPKRKR